GPERRVPEVDERPRVAGTQLGRTAERLAGLLETACDGERVAQLAPGVGVVRGDGNRLLEVAERLRLVKLETRRARETEQSGVVRPVSQGGHRRLARAPKVARFVAGARLLDHSVARAPHLAAEHRC